MNQQGPEEVLETVFISSEPPWLLSISVWCHWMVGKDGKLMLSLLIIDGGRFMQSCRPSVQIMSANMCKGEVRHFPPVSYFAAWWDISYF